MFANIIFLYTQKQLTQFIWFVGIIILYYLALKFNAAPGFMAGDLTEAGNFASYIDRTWMPGRLHRGFTIQKVFSLLYRLSLLAYWESSLEISLKMILAMGQPKRKNGNPWGDFYCDRFSLES